MARELTDAQAALRRLADATRDVIARTVASSAPSEVLSEAAEAVERAAELLDGFPQGLLYEGFAELSVSKISSDLVALGNMDNRLDENNAVYDHSPVAGRGNSLAPPIVMRIERAAASGSGHDVVIGEVTFSSAYEGPPSCVHGGFIAAAFDEVLGVAQNLSGKPGMTGRLTVNYRKPTPLRKPLVFRAWLDHVDGRKVFVKGTVEHEGVVSAEADGLFIQVNFAEKFAGYSPAKAAASASEEAGNP